MATYDKAITLAYQTLQLNPRSAETMGDLALYYAKKGDAVHSVQYIRQARAIEPSDLQLLYSETQVLALAGKQSDALHSLRAAIEKGYSPEEARNDPELRSLQGLPEFARLVEAKR
jgi:Flp pilus assembly protein TadD